MTNQVPVISPWLVTPSHPPSSLASLDYTRCAVLHNYIIQEGWVGSGRPLDELPRESWFEKHGDDAEQIRNRLDPSLASFLEKAYVIDSTQVSFFYWVSKLSNPDELWRNNGPDFNEPGEDWRFLTLYPTNIGLASDSDGLNYDQKECKAIMQMDIMDGELTRSENSPPWYPLETVLSTWITMMSTGKIIPAAEIVTLENEKYSPWLNLPHSQYQLADSVAAFERLAAAIESRMPSSSPPPSPSSPLLSHTILGAAAVPASGFARSFLTTVHAPRFKFIAPGLLLPNHFDFASAQPFTHVPNEDDCRIPIPPILLFRATSNTVHIAPGDDRNNPFHDPYYDALSAAAIPAGLYTDSTDRGHSDIEEDGFRLFLPFTLGENGFARKSDGRRFESQVDLYQHGYWSFGGDTRAQRLVRLLAKWTEMVESGKWKVDEDGVEGGIEKFREADTDEGWEGYWIANGW